MFPIHDYMIYVPLVAQNICISLRISIFLFRMKGPSHNCTSNVLIPLSFLPRPIGSFDLRVLLSTQTYTCYIGLALPCGLSHHVSKGNVKQRSLISANEPKHTARIMACAARSAKKGAWRWRCWYPSTKRFYFQLPIASHPVISINWVLTFRALGDDVISECTQGGPAWPRHF